MIMSDKKISSFHILHQYQTGTYRYYINALQWRVQCTMKKKNPHTNTYTKQKHSDFSTIRFLNLRAETNQYFFFYIFGPVFYVCMKTQEFHRYLHHCIPIMGPHFPGVQYLYFSVYNFLGSCHVSYTFVTSCS